MTSKILSVRRLMRVEGDTEEVLEFSSGVNVIVGEPNTGKTSWLRMLDYLFGDTGTIEDAVGEDLANKYVRAQVELAIDGKPMVLERRWKEKGAKGKVFVDGSAMPAADFSAFFLAALNIPVVYIPKGNPYSQNTWPELSWRTLLRHIYRHEGSWSDLALKQPEADQFAVFSQFIGSAPAIFSLDYAKLVDAQKREARLAAQKENFAATLDDVARELVYVQEASAGFTRDSLASAMTQLQADIAAQEAQRETAMQELRRAAESRASAENEPRASEFEKLGLELDAARVRRSELQVAVDKGLERVAELSAHLKSTKEELGKLERARAAGAILGPLHVTHCPVCDRPISRKAAAPGTCYLCHQPQEPRSEEAAATTARLDFEMQQLKEEVGELQELLSKTQGDLDLDRRKLRDVEDSTSRLESMLQPVRTAAAWILPPALGLTAHETGRLQERLRQLQRIESALSRREALAQHLDDLRKEIGHLESQVVEKEAAPDFTTLGDQVADGMTDYLNALDAEGRNIWEARRVSINVSKNAVQFLVDGRPWSRKLGANLRAYFFLAYHYAWLKLSRTEPFTYPGFALLDFPANLSDFAISDQENYLLTPFVKLLSKPELRGAQLIASGRAFADLPGAHHVSLNKKWR
ncbi:MAG: hypothetical protein JXB05_02835 [Myxococcaceae bacterium]|nr:hypothetical protein [Myxococcaceae bacterium]